MKRIITVFALMMTSLVVANHDLHKIERLIQPYEGAIEFVMNLDPAHQINDHDVFIFFSKHDLFQKKDIQKFNSVVRTIKKLTYSKKSLLAHRGQLEVLIVRLEKVQDFITKYASMHYALINYYDIAARYFYIDEHHESVVDLIVRQSEKLGLPSMEKGRGLYKFAKKIDKDIHQLAVLFLQTNPSDDLVVKMNQLKTKLVVLKSKIVENSMYRSQLSKTRWLKAIGSITVYAAAVVAPILIFEEISLGGAFIIGYVGGIIIGNIIIH